MYTKTDHQAYYPHLTFNNKVKEILLSENDTLFLWIPVLFGIGILCYFKLSFEPDVKVSIITTLLLIVGIFSFRKIKFVFWFFLISLLISSGFTSANIRSIYIKAPVITKKIGIKNIVGTIERIDSRPKGKRFLLTNLEIEGINQHKTPKKIRISINKDSSFAKPGDVISITANLSPPPKPVIPDGYDFSRYAYFQQIGAVGYAVSDVTKLQDNESPQLVQALRQTIKETIVKHSNDTHAHIANALLVGEKGGINKATMENVRVSGIAHILAISGMHLSLVAAIFFFFSRLAFASIEKLALNFHIKKWSALIAILGSFAYLLISGSPISAQRAFIMTTLILTAIMIDRTGIPMRSAAIAALLILAATPESILSPSFQMSFAAVFALISMYEMCKNVFNNYQEYGKIRKLLLYLFGIIFSSLVAGIATAPFAAYHFNNFAPYGVITNLIVVPITSLFIMPFGVISLLLMPFGLEQIGLVPMFFGIDIIVKTANYIASLPQPVGLIGQIPDASLALITLGGVIILFLKTKLRYLGAFFIVTGIIISLNKEVPNLIIGNDGKLFAVKDNQQNLMFSSKVHERYSREQWQKRYAITEPKLISQADKKIINCDSARCLYQYNDHKATITKHPIALEEDCKHADVIINLTYIKKTCNKPTLIINKKDILKNGVHILFFNKNNILIKNVKTYENDRLWQQD